MTDTTTEHRCVCGGAGPTHRECMFRAVVGGIGHHINHEVWCLERDDPDGGLSYRESALAVWMLRTVIMVEVVVHEGG